MQPHKLHDSPGRDVICTSLCGQRWTCAICLAHTPGRIPANEIYCKTMRSLAACTGRAPEMEAFPVLPSQEVLLIPVLVNAGLQSPPLLGEQPPRARRLRSICISTVLLPGLHRFVSAGFYLEGRGRQGGKSFCGYENQLETKRIQTKGKSHHKA